jgi:hypothetical protein
VSQEVDAQNRSLCGVAANRERPLELSEAVVERLVTGEDASALPRGASMRLDGVGEQAKAAQRPVP